MSLAGIVGIIAGILTVIGSVIVIVKWSLDRFNKLDQKTDAIGFLLFIIAQELLQLEKLKERSKGKIMSALANFNIKFEGSIKKAYEDIKIEKNPISQVELDRLEQHIGKIKRAESLNLQEAQDFNIIAEKIRDDKPSDIHALLLSGLAGFVLGLIIGAISEK